MRVQIIEKDGRPEWAVLPYTAYVRLVEAAEVAEDVRDYKTALAHPEEVVPIAVLDRILAGEGPVKVWREYRALTQQQLAEAAGISTPYLSQIESGQRQGRAEVLAAIAAVLSITVDELVNRPGR